MTQTGSEAHSDAGAAPPAQPAASPDRTGGRRLPPGLAVLLVALVAVIGVLGGYAVAAVWPWGGAAPVSREQYAALAARVAALENRRGAVAQIAAAQNALGQRLDRLEAEGRQAQQTPTAQLQQLASRVEVVEKQSAALDAAVAAAAKAQQELARLATVAADLERRLSALEAQLKSQASAARTTTPLLLALLQIREAVEAERPFPAEYATLQALAGDRPDLAATAAPLAQMAPAGAPSRGVLRRGLDELADKIAAATVPPPDQGWEAQALARLRGIVTIRRIDAGSEMGGPQAAVAAARRDLAAGDLGGAVAALQPLAGADAAAAQPWLRLARQRLAVETALARLQQLATTPASPAPPPHAPS